MNTEYLEFNNNITFFHLWGNQKKEKKINSLSEIYTTNNKKLRKINNIGKILIFQFKTPLKQ